MDFGIVSVAAITVICFLVTQLIKTIGLDNKWCPVVAGTVGAILGPIGLKVMPDFPATDILTAIAVGIVSGLAATGAHQIYKQLGGTNE